MYGMNQSVPCDAGAYCPQASSVSRLCLRGTFSDQTNLTAASECDDCPAGSACEVGAVVPSECAPGSFSGSEGAAACERCAPGTYQGERGKLQCKTCTSGYYCAEGASAPLPCPAGYTSNMSILMKVRHDNNVTLECAKRCRV